METNAHKPNGRLINLIPIIILQLVFISSVFKAGCIDLECLQNLTQH